MPSRLDLGIKARWRRQGEDAIVTPGIHAQMLATRAEAQLAGDWMLVPACRNLHWPYTVLHEAFLVCKEKVAPGDTGNKNLTVLIEAATSISQRLKSGTITHGGVKRPHNNDIQQLLNDDGITAEENYFAFVPENNTQHRWMSGFAPADWTLLVWFACGRK